MVVCTKEERRRQSPILRRRRDLPRTCQLIQKSRHFVRTHVLGVAHPMIMNIAPHPMDVFFLGPQAVATKTKRLAQTSYEPALRGQ